MEAEAVNLATSYVYMIEMVLFGEVDYERKSPEGKLASLSWKLSDKYMCECTYDFKRHF